MQDDTPHDLPDVLFSKIVPNCKKLGLLDAADGWLRERFTDLGVIQFEDWVDTGEEYDSLDEVAADRAVLMRIRVLGTLIVVVSALVGVVPSAPVGAEVDPALWRVRRPLNIPHAGGDLEAPHETMYAYKRAVAVGADMLEMDLRLSRDGQLMVVHDDTVDRTTNANGSVRDFTASELQALDNAYWFVPNCWSCHDRPAAEYSLRGVRTGVVAPPAGYQPDDFAIPTFEQILTTFPDRLLDVEIKDGPDGMLAAEKLAARLTGSPRGQRVVVVSFDDDILAHFRALAPDIATSPGLGETTEWFLGDRGALPGKVALQVPPVYSGLEIVTQEFVVDAHAANLAVWVWFNGNDDDVPDEWNRLLDLGVDGLITGKPALLQTVLDARGQHFRSGLRVGPIEARGRRARVTVGCPMVAADRCFALLAVRADGDVVGGALVDLPPGQQRRYRIVPDGVKWRRLARAGLSFEWWGTDDVGAATAPATLTKRR